MAVATVPTKTIKQRIFDYMKRRKSYASFEEICSSQALKDASKDSVRRILNYLHEDGVLNKGPTKCRIAKDTRIGYKLRTA